MRDARTVSKAVASVTESVKMNYEIHGNSIPHLHMHFFPRYQGDQFEGQPINPRVVMQPVYVPGSSKEPAVLFNCAWLKYGIGSLGRGNRRFVCFSLIHYLFIGIRDINPGICIYLNCLLSHSAAAPSGDGSLRTLTKFVRMRGTND